MEMSLAVGGMPVYLTLQDLGKKLNIFRCYERLQKRTDKRLVVAINKSRTTLTTIPKCILRLCCF
jgi:hypothetical protein